MRLNRLALTVTFRDGGTASGSFNYDAATNTYSQVQLTTTPGTVRTTGASYGFVCGQDVPTCNGINPVSGSNVLNHIPRFGHRTIQIKVREIEG